MSKSEHDDVTASALSLAVEAVDTLEAVAGLATVLLKGRDAAWTNVVLIARAHLNGEPVDDAVRERLTGLINEIEAEQPHTAALATDLETAQRGAAQNRKFIAKIQKARGEA